VQGDPSESWMSSDLGREEILHFDVYVSGLVLRGTTRPSVLLLTWLNRKHKTHESASFHWDEEWHFTIQSSERLLKTQKLTITVLQEGPEFGSASLPLWEVVTGPPAQSFPVVGNRGKVVCRVEAEIKALQVTLLRISPTHVQCTLTPSQFGNFSLTVKYLAEREQETRHSPISPSPQWTFSHQLQFESFSTVQALRTAAVQLRLWRQDEKDLRDVLVAECWIGLGKLLKAKGPEDSRTKNRRWSERESEITIRKQGKEVERRFGSKLWLCGRHVGDVEGRFRVSGVPHITQLLFGVHTEEGISLQSSHLQVSSASTPRHFPLSAPLQRINGLFAQLKSLTGQQHESSVQASTQLNAELQSTERNQRVVFIYEHEEELIEAQMLLLEVGEFLRDFAEEVGYEERGLYYEGLKVVIGRGELDLGHLALDRELSAALSSRKLAVGLRFWALLKSLLKCALSKSNEKGLDSHIRDFVNTILSDCYFKFSSFRDLLLHSVKEKSFGPVPEWRNTASDLDEEVQVPPWSLPMFDWARYFVHFLPREEQDLQAEVRTSPLWQKRMAKRGLSFFRFLRAWIEYVERCFVHKYVPWPDIPGYHVLIKSFLLELKQRPIGQLPAALITASIHLLSNPHLVSVFILVLYQRTNLYSPRAVTETLTLTSQWLTTIQEAGSGLPLTFPESFFTRSIELVLYCDLEVNTGNAIWMLYYCYQVLTAEIREGLVLNGLLGKQVGTFMCHWSESVRRLFWSFVLFRLISLKTIPLEPITLLDQRILTRVDEIIQSFSHFDLISPEQRPYFSHSQAEYRHLRADFETWLYSKTPEFGAGRKGKFGPFAVFPYPDIQQLRGREDRQEKRIEM